MRRLLIPGLMACLTVLSPAATADQTSRTHGGDTYVAGDTLTETFVATGDVFAAGSVITTAGMAGGDLHTAGYDLNISTRTGGDLYAAGSSVTIGADVGQDVTAAGFSLRSTDAARIAGNLRFFGNALTIESPVAGALTAFGRTVHLNAPVTGDAWITANTVTFGPQALIKGQLILTSQDGTTVPERVIPDSRITREDWQDSNLLDGIAETWDPTNIPGLPDWLSLLSAFLISAIFLLLLAAVFLTFAPSRVDRLRRRVTGEPLRSFLLGVVGLSALFGMVPVTALTVVGLPFVLFALLFIAVAWTLGYLLAAWAVARRVIAGFGGPDEPALLVNLLAVALAIVVVGLLNFIPFVGWVVNYTLVLLGIGAMTWGLLASFIPDPDPALDVDMKPLPRDQT